MNFESLLLTSPSGFAQRCNEVNALVAADPSAFQQACVAAALSSAPSSSSSSSSSPPSSSAQHPPRPVLPTSCPSTGVQECVAYVYAAHRRSRDRPSATEVASVLTQTTTLSADAVQAVASHLPGTDNVNDPTARPGGHRLGQLVDFRWRLGVAVSSNTCADLAHPYVAVSFAVVESDGTRHHHHAELSVEDFHEVDRGFREAAAVMDSL
jgi:hypothetical protein